MSVFIVDYFSMSVSSSKLCSKPVSQNVFSQMKFACLFTIYQALPPGTNLNFVNDALRNHHFLYNPSTHSGLYFPKKVQRQLLATNEEFEKILTEISDQISDYQKYEGHVPNWLTSDYEKLRSGGRVDLGQTNLVLNSMFKERQF